MSSPSFFSDGSTPRVNATRWVILQKILGATIDGGGGGAGTPQVFTGSGAPVGLQAGQDGTLAGIYYDTAVGGFNYNWDVASQAWF